MVIDWIWAGWALSLSKDYLSEEGARLIARAYKMSRGLPAG
jgi:hypothetical protein